MALYKGDIKENFPSNQSVRRKRLKLRAPCRSGIPMNQVSRIFISYSHRGNGPEWKALLLYGLHVFEQHHLLDVWQDGKIRISSCWHDGIKQAMGSARLAVVLLTREALESEYEVLI